LIAAEENFMGLESKVFGSILEFIPHTGTPPSEAFEPSSSKEVSKTKAA
jgi:hypothetical protein